MLFLMEVSLAVNLDEKSRPVKRRESRCSRSATGTRPGPWPETERISSLINDRLDYKRPEVAKSIRLTPRGNSCIFAYRGKNHQVFRKGGARVQGIQGIRHERERRRPGRRLHHGRRVRQDRDLPDQRHHHAADRPSAREGRFLEPVYQPLGQGGSHPWPKPRPPARRRSLRAFSQHGHRVPDHRLGRSSSWSNGEQAQEETRPGRSAAPTTKECPFCSTIPVKAVRCPTCTSALK